MAIRRGAFALTEHRNFPFMGDTAEVTAVAYQRIYERHARQADEHKGVVVLSVFTHGPARCTTPSARSTR